MHHWQAMEGWHLFGMGLWWLVLLAILGAVIWLLAGGAGNTPPDDPEEVLRRRFATGEIDRDEYRRRLDELRQR